MPTLLDLAYGLTIVPHYLWHRTATGRYGPAAPEKLGRPPVRSGDAPCLWLHAVSVGEALGARPLVRAFAAAHPAWETRVSVTTATGREVAVREWGEPRVFYWPLDLSWMVDGALDRIRPSLVLLMELEVWPQFLFAAQRRGLPVAVVNARITERSARRFARFGRAAAEMLNRVRLWLCQSQEYADRLLGLGVRPETVEVVGSLKFDSVPDAPDPEWRRSFRALLGAGPGDPVLVAGSTHRGEEEAMLAAFDALRAGRPGLRLVLVPRHPERLDEVERLMARSGPVVRRSRLDGAAGTPPHLVLVDTMGELAKLYAAADAVFVGGSLIPHGGQNMMEPCGLERPTVIGSSQFNFADAMSVLRECGGIREADAGGLAEEFRRLLDDPAAAAAMAGRARAALVARKGAVRRTIERLAPLLPTS